MSNPELSGMRLKLAVITIMVSVLLALSQASYALPMSFSKLVKDEINNPSSVFDVGKNIIPGTLQRFNRDTFNLLMKDGQWLGIFNYNFSGIDSNSIARQFGVRTNFFTDSFTYLGLVGMFTNSGSDSYFYSDDSRFSGVRPYFSRDTLEDPNVTSTNKSQGVRGQGGSATPAKEVTVTEPATMLLLGVGLVLLGFTCRKQDS